jgi:hypothetical protein
MHPPVGATRKDAQQERGQGPQARQAKPAGSTARRPLIDIRVKSINYCRHAAPIEEQARCRSEAGSLLPPHQFTAVGHGCFLDPSARAPNST